MVRSLSAAYTNRPWTRNSGDSTRTVCFLPDSVMNCSLFAFTLLVLGAFPLPPDGASTLGRRDDDLRELRPRPVREEDADGERMLDDSDGGPVVSILTCASGPNPKPRRRRPPRARDAARWRDVRAGGEYSASAPFGGVHASSSSSGADDESSSRWSANPRLAAAGRDTRPFSWSSGSGLSTNAWRRFPIFFLSAAHDGGSSDNTIGSSPEPSSCATEGTPAHVHRGGRNELRRTGTFPRLRLQAHRVPPRHLRTDGKAR